MSKFTAISGALALSLSLSACAVIPYVPGPNALIATDNDTGLFDRGSLIEGQAAIAYDPDGCQGWLIDDGIEGYSGRRFDPVSGLPVCNSLYPPGTVIGNPQTASAGFGDWAPRPK